MKKTIPILVFITIFLSSCLAKFALNRLGVFEKSVSLRYISNEKMQIVFLPMHHIGTEAFYKDEVRIVDSLLKKGYTVFYEGVNQGNITDEVMLDTMKLQFRKITGLPTKSKGKAGTRVDTINNTILGRKSNLVSKYKLRNQDVAYFKNLDGSLVKNVDASLAEMIQLYEKKYGKILLDKYDFETTLGDEYKFKISKEKRNYFMLESRNIIITNAIVKSTANKIALIYGEAHYDGILENLRINDRNYKEIPNF